MQVKLYKHINKEIDHVKPKDIQTQLGVQNYFNL